VWSWHHDDKNNFDLQQVLVDNTTGKVAIEKVGFMTALAIGSFGFIALLFQEKMTEWYAGLYMGTFAVARLGSSWISIKKYIADKL
jgi:hypothetical protein